MEALRRYSLEDCVDLVNKVTPDCKMGLEGQIFDAGMVARAQVVADMGIGEMKQADADTGMAEMKSAADN